MDTMWCEIAYAHEYICLSLDVLCVQTNLLRGLYQNITHVEITLYHLNVLLTAVLHVLYGERYKKNLHDWPKTMKLAEQVDVC